MNKLLLILRQISKTYPNLPVLIVSGSVSYKQALCTTKGPPLD